MGGYPVSLSSIGAVPQNCEAFFRSPVGTLQKTRFFFEVFLDQNVIIFPPKWSIFLLAHLLQSNRRLP